MACEILVLMGFLLYLRLPKEALWLGFWFCLISGLYALVSTLDAPQVIERPLFLLRKMSPLVGVMILSLRSMSVSELIAGLQKLYCPKSISLALAIALRFIPTIRQELSQIKDAMKTRGVSLNFVTFVKAPTVTMEYLLIPFMMRCIKVADELAAAAVTRAIENPAPRGMRIPMKIRPREIVYLMLVIGTNSGVLLYSYLGWTGGA
jgi:energy-coupling factor transport system permease protein